MAGFFDRKRIGFGTFFDAAAIESQPGRRLSDMLEGRAPVRVIRAGSASAIASRRAAGPGCYAQVFIDGMRVYAPSRARTLFDINSISPDMLQGIEFYASPATTPPEYGGQASNCGTLLLWTK
jgi:hypothetical protein